jgi:hypothetical protein
MAQLTGIPARKVQRGMHVRLSPGGPLWTVLERHPIVGHWWLHRHTVEVIDGEHTQRWITTSARYSAMEQVLDANV